MIKKHIPNAITSLNLVAGVWGIIQCLEGELLMASYMIFLAAVFDFFDGFAARLLKVSSPIGKELDSLADVVSFGVLPGLILYKVILQVGGGNDWMAYAAFLIPVFSALRLAKFNLDTRQSDSFIGVPTPANAMLMASLPFLMRQYPDLAFELLQQPLLAALALLMSWLMVAELPLLALKFKQYGLKGNEYRYALIAFSLGMLLWLGFAGLSLIILFYILISALHNATRKPTK